MYIITLNLYTAMPGVCSIDKNFENSLPFIIVILMPNNISEKSEIINF